MTADRDRATDAGNLGAHSPRSEFMMDAPDLMQPFTTADENAAGGWKGVNAPVGGTPPPTRPVGSRGGPDGD